VIRHISAAAAVLACLGAAPAFAQGLAGPRGHRPGTAAQVGNSSPAAQQTAPEAAAPAPALRRWLDVEQVSAASRYRWFENSAGRVTSSSVQWQSQLRGRFLLDEAARYRVGVLASTGGSFVSSWNNTGAGIGQFARPFNVKQLFVSAEPVPGLEFEAGGLFMNRGELAENITYDVDAYIVGQRVTVRPSSGPVTEVAVTAGHFGDLAEPSVFERLDSMTDFNYGQALMGFGLGARADASVEYTHQDGRDILRQGVALRLPQTVKAFRSVKLEAYQRVSGDKAAGFNAAADLRWGRLTVTAGVMSVDKDYGGFNGDRYDIGKRWYSLGTYALTRDFSIGWFQGEAFGNSFPVPLKHRFDIIATFNPTASLKRAGVF
jgi:hypothetical protein